MHASRNAFFYIRTYDRQEDVGRKTKIIRSQHQYGEDYWFFFGNSKEDAVFITTVFVGTGQPARDMLLYMGNVILLPS